MNFTHASLLCLSLWLSSSVRGAEVAFAKVTHAPAQPRSGETVRITAEASSPPGPTAPVLEYQIVEPGQYIERADPAYAKQWTAIPMRCRRPLRPLVGSG